MEAFRYGMRQGIPRENITARFYKTFYYWNRAQATCSELQESGKYVLRRFQGTRAVVYDKVVDGVHNRRPHATAHKSDTRQYSTSPSKSQHAAAHSKSVGRLGLGTSNMHIQPDLATHVRHLMRRIPHPVVVITSAAPSADTDEGPIEATFRGMTVSSFNTVALEPVPLVSFNVRVPSATYTAMTESGTFLAHFLISSPAGARIADTFAKGGNSEGAVFRSLATDSVAGEVKIFSGTGTNGAPLIAGPGVMQVLRCRMLEGKEIEVGDHRVIVAEASSILAQPGMEDSLSDKAFGLMYCDRQYRNPGAEIDPRPSSTQSGSVHKAFVAEESIQRTMGLNLRRGDEAVA